MLISHSQSILTLTNKDVSRPCIHLWAMLIVLQVGHTVNVEVDVVGKYVLGSTDRLEATVNRIVEKRLKEKGL
jgi:riboflavin synthase